MIELGELALVGQGRSVPVAGVVRFRAALRRAVRRNAASPSIDALNITAMLDMMTIILVFLLRSSASSYAAPPQNDQLRLPGSTLTTQPRDGGVAVLVSRTQIVVGESSEPVVALPGRDVLASSGLGASLKRGGANDLYVVPLGNALFVAREQADAVRKVQGLSGPVEGVLIADSDTPYRLVLEVLYTMSQAEIGRFHLLVLSGKGR
jgi:biopolymer transport protein ExbD